MLRTCLVVDDSRIVRAFVRFTLEELDYVVVEAANGREALQYCQEFLPDAVVLDWNMPEMDGLSFLERLRQMPGGGAPAVIFCTSNDDLRSIQRAIDAGANDYMAKPFDGDVLKARFTQLGLC